MCDIKYKEKACPTCCTFETVSMSTVKCPYAVKQGIDGKFCPWRYVIPGPDFAAHVDCDDCVKEKADKK